MFGIFFMTLIKDVFFFKAAADVFIANALKIRLMSTTSEQTDWHVADEQSWEISFIPMMELKINDLTSKVSGLK